MSRILGNGNHVRFERKDEVKVTAKAAITNSEGNEDIVELSIYPEAGGRDITALVLSDPSPFSSRSLVIELTGPIRKRLIEALLSEQEKFD